MKVLLVNGSTKTAGNTARALGEVASALERHGIEPPVAEMDVMTNFVR